MDLTSQPCDVCDTGVYVERHGDYEFTWPEKLHRKPSLFRNADWLQCSECGERVLSSELQARIEAKRYRIDGLLTPSEMHDARENLRLTQVEMAHLLGVGDKTYTRWERGLSVQTMSMDTLIRLAVLFPDALKAVQQWREAEGGLEPAGAWVHHTPSQRFLAKAGEWRRYVAVGNSGQPAERPLAARSWAGGILAVAGASTETKSDELIPAA